MGFSGGMDSAYSAILLKEAGYDVTAVNLVMHQNCDFSAEAEYTAKKLGIDIIIVDVVKRFEETVILPFSRQYISGVTPNPCIICNPEMKFKLLFEAADNLGADFVATGHYVRKTVVNGRYSFAPAADAFKDQAYFLYRLPQEYISRLLFPLDGIEKKQIKEYFATYASDVLCSSKESYDICFIGNKKYEDIVSEYVELPPCGDIIDVNGNVIGKHKGIHAYTIGQRKGLGVALGKPAFVSDINPNNNTITLSYAEDNFVTGFSITEPSFLAVDNVEIGDSYYVKVRYKAKSVKCTVVKIDKGIIFVAFETPQKPVAIGQSAVFYDEYGIISFGGFIC